MKATILMASRGADGWDRFLSTLLNQTRLPDQVIIVFDRRCSNEEQQQIQDKWPQITFLFNGRNIGLTASLNRGLKTASGDYIFRADDDDWYRADRIEKQLACFEETGADLVASWGEGVLDGEDSASYLIKCPTGNTDIQMALMKRNILLHPSLAFRRDRISALGGYDEVFECAQDYALYLAAIRAGYCFAAVPEPLVQRYYGKASITISRRYHQLMYSCAAKIAHHAHDGNRKDFFLALFQYAGLALTPNWLRTLRRRFFKWTGQGI